MLIDFSGEAVQLLLSDREICEYKFVSDWFSATLLAVFVLAFKVIPGIKAIQVIVESQATQVEVVSQDFLVSPGTAGIRGVAGGLENRDTRVIQATLGVQVIQALADIRGIRDIRGFRVE